MGISSTFMARTFMARTFMTRTVLARTLWLAVIASLLGGCSWMRGGEGLLLDTKDDYLEVVEVPPLQVPEDLRSLETTDPFPIPAVEAPANPRYFPERPPLPDAIYANDNRDEVRIQRLQDRRWLVIPESPTTVWPKLKQFLSENGVALNRDDPSNGRLNTEWMTIEASQYRDVVRTLLRDAREGVNLNRGNDRFLIRVEQGLRDMTTEVHIRHENDSLTLPVEDDLVDLQTMNSDIAKAEEELLSEMGAYIAANVSQQTVSKVAQQIGSVKKAELTRDNTGAPLLRLYLDYQRAWATLGQAFNNAEIEVRTLDEAVGMYAISIPQSTLVGEETDGFFCRLTFSCTDDDVYDVQVQILARDQKTFDVSILEDGGQSALDPDLAQQVLVLIREYAT